MSNGKFVIFLIMLFGAFGCAGFLYYQLNQKYDIIAAQRHISFNPTPAPTATPKPKPVVWQDGTIEAISYSIANQIEDDNVNPISYDNLILATVIVDVGNDTGTFSATAMSMNDLPPIAAVANVGDDVSVVLRGNIVCKLKSGDYVVTEKGC